MKSNFIKCETIKQMIVEQADGEGSILKKMIINYHLRKCRGCKTWSAQKKKADEFITESLDNVISKIEMPPGLYARIESVTPSEKDYSDVKHSCSGTDAVRKIKRPIPQLAFRFASIMISLLLLCNIYNNIFKF
jgi:predicted anti-sigma-YlaC factor YlaD